MLVYSVFLANPRYIHVGSLRIRPITGPSKPCARSFSPWIVNIHPNPIYPDPPAKSCLTSAWVGASAGVIILSALLQRCEMNGVCSDHWGSPVIYQRLLWLSTTEYIGMEEGFEHCASRFSSMVLYSYCIGTNCTCIPHDMECLHIPNERRLEVAAPGILGIPRNLAAVSLLSTFANTVCASIWSAGDGCCSMKWRLE